MENIDFILDVLIKAREFIKDNTLTNDTQEEVINIINEAFEQVKKLPIHDVSKPDFKECPKCKSKDIEATGFGSMSMRTKQTNEIFECRDCCHQFCKA